MENGGGQEQSVTRDEESPHVMAQCNKLLPVVHGQQDKTEPFNIV